MASTVKDRQAQKEKPSGNHVMYQTWEELLFLHWKIDAEKIQKILPHGLTVDTFDGQAWIGIVPFFMKKVRPRFLPALPWMSYFMELNVRTYVVDSTGLPGVWFNSLDCNQPLAVELARRFFYLPYEHAKMKANLEGSYIRYSCRRNEETAYFEYESIGETEEAKSDSLESFLIDRYWLFSNNKRTNQLFRGRVWHLPYKVGQAKVNSWSSLPIEWNGFSVETSKPDHIIRAETVDVQIYQVEKVTSL